jgi:hypothetical protein
METGRETHVWKHMFTQIYGGQLFVEHDGSSRYTAKINNDNHYSDYFIKYDTYINRHASKLLDDGISTSRCLNCLERCRSETIPT